MTPQERLARALVALDSASDRAGSLCQFCRAALTLNYEAAQREVIAAARALHESEPASKL